MTKRKNPSPVKKGGIQSYFSVIPKTPPKQPRGRPRKVNAVAEAAVAPTIDEATEEVATGTAGPRQKQAMYINYNNPVAAASLKEAVEYHLASGKILTSKVAELSDTPFVYIPPSTIRYHAKKTIELQNDKMAPSPPSCLNSGESDIFLSPLKGKKCLTTKTMRQFLAHTVKFRDEAQNGMSRKEVIQLIMKLTGANEKTSENHFDWCISTQRNSLN